MSIKSVQTAVRHGARKPRQRKQASVFRAGSTRSAHLLVCCFASGLTQTKAFTPAGQRQERFIVKFRRKRRRRFLHHRRALAAETSRFNGAALPIRRAILPDTKSRLPRRATARRGRVILLLKRFNPRRQADRQRIRQTWRMVHTDDTESGRKTETGYIPDIAKAIRFIDCNLRRCRKSCLRLPDIIRPRRSCRGKRQRLLTATSPDIREASA